MAEELGDVLFQVVFYAQLGSERDLFSFQTIIDTLVDKLLRRHPHVFADGEIEGVVSARASVESVKESWESIKQEERSAKSQRRYSRRCTAGSAGPAKGAETAETGRAGQF